MDNENHWTKFCEETNQFVKNVKENFKKPELTFVDNASSVEIKKKSDEVSLKAMKAAAMDLAEVEGEKKKEFEGKIDEILNCIRERDTKIEGWKNDTDENKKQLGDWYKKAKHDCDDLCAKLENYTNDKLGVLNLFADIMEVVIDKEGLYMEKAKTTIKGKIRSEKRSCFWRFVADVTLLLIFLGVIGVLFVMIGTDKVLCGINPTDLGKWIAAGFILALLVAIVFLIIRICSLIKKRNREIRQLQLLLDKMEIHKMTKHEIDRELERIQKTV